MEQIEEGQETTISCPASVHVHVTTHNGVHQIRASAGRGALTYHYKLPGPMTALEAHNAATRIANTLDKSKHRIQDKPSMHYPEGSLFYPGKGYDEWVSGKVSNRRDKRDVNKAVHDYRRKRVSKSA